MRKLMLRAANRGIAAVDSFKWGGSGSFRIRPLRHVDTLLAAVDGSR